MKRSKFDTEWFVAKAIAIHGNKYDYSKVVYVDSTTPITIIDRDHGEFDIIPTNHLRGFSNKNLVRKSPLVRKSLFIAKARAVHGELYDYSRAEFHSGVKGSQICIIDKETGEEFWQTPQWHLKHGRSKTKTGLQIDHIVPLRFLGKNVRYDSFVRASPMFKLLDSPINRREIASAANNSKSDSIIISGVKYRARQINQNHSLLRMALHEHLKISFDKIDQVFREHAKYMIPTGKLVAFVGPMFASKTTSLLRSFDESENGIIIKVKFDNRYAEDAVVSHDGISRTALSIKTWNSALMDEHQNFFFDEIQFFTPPYFDDDVVDVIKKLLNAGKNVWVAGLDMDYTGKPFSFSPLLAMADTVHKLKACCHVCGKPATKTFKLSGEGESVELGAGDKYEARCNEHWVNRT